MAIAFIGLGSNMADPVDQLQRALFDIRRLSEVSLLAVSSFYRSAPVGFLEQPDFINAVAKLDTSLPAEALLRALLDVELLHGRKRTFRNAPRTLDLDVLLYQGVQMQQHGLTIPHPQMHKRAFVLQPLLELAPECDIPGVGLARDFAAGCVDQQLEKLSRPALA